MKKKITKRQALSIFKKEAMKLTITQFGKLDKVAMCEAWGIFTDSLCKDGLISMKQYESWTNPF